MVLPHIQSGKVIPLLVTDRKRLELLPDVSSVIELKLLDLEMVGWSCLLAPARTPRHIIDRLNQEILKIYQDAEIARQFALSGGTMVKTSPEETVAFIQSERAKWARLVKESGAKVD